MELYKQTVNNMDGIIENLRDSINTVLAFLSGDLLATVFSVYFFTELQWLHPILKLIMSFLVGIFGGLGGLFIKTFYSAVEPSIKKQIKIWLKK